MKALDPKDMLEVVSNGPPSAETVALANPAAVTAAQIATLATAKAAYILADTAAHTRSPVRGYVELKDKAREVRLFSKLSHRLLHLLNVQNNALASPVTSGEGKVFHEPLDDRVQPAGANIFHVSVDLGGELRHPLLCRVCDLEMHALREHERILLLDQIVLRRGSEGAPVAPLEDRKACNSGKPQTL